jgi:myosin-5
MSSKEAVWVRTGAIAKALGQEAQSSKKERSSLDWDWTRALLLSSSPIVLQVDDEDSEFNQKKVQLVSETGTSPNLLPSNADVQGSIPPDDLIVLTHLHEPEVVYSLQNRFERDLIYTATSPILIALNPFKELPGLYDDDIMEKYWAAGERIETESHPLKPHVYGSSHGAFRTMMRSVEQGYQRCDQSILVSGESGAGKTVTTKHIMKYLATLSQRKAEHAKRHRAPSPGRSENVVPARRSVLARRTSRATSWKAGALIEEKSK